MLTDLDRSLMKEFILEHSEGDILDCGCGTGETIKMLYTCRPGKLIGIDISPQKVNDAIQSLSEEQVPDKRIDFEIMDLERLAFNDAQFDTVIMTDTLQYIRHPLMALAEVHRVLRPNGKLLVAITVEERGTAHLGDYDISKLPDQIGQGFRIGYIEKRGGVVRLVAVKKGGNLKRVIE